MNVSSGIVLAVFAAAPLATGAPRTPSPIRSAAVQPSAQTPATTLVAPSESDRERWTRAWSDFAELERATPGSPAYRQLFDDLSSFQSSRERRARKTHDRASAFRARVLRTYLERMRNLPPRAVAEPGIELEFLPGEAWRAAQVLVPGRLRLRAMVEALAEVDAPDADLRRTWVRTTLREDLNAVRIDGLAPVARVLHERAPSLENTELLCDVLVFTGDEREAAELLEREIGRPAAERDARVRAFLCGRTHLALNERHAAERWLGAALTAGSDRAAILLGRIALSDDARERALRIFGSVLGNTADPALDAWARRGWGFALLSRSEPADDARDARDARPTDSNLPTTPSSD